MVTKEELQSILTEKEIPSNLIEFIISNLFKEEIKTPWDWVKEEYVEYFAHVGKEKHLKESLARMKKFFSENPDVRKEEVIGATIMYIRSTEARYIRLPHYFISKGVGSEKTSDLFNWIEKYRITHAPETGQRDISRNLQ